MDPKHWFKVTSRFVVEIKFEGTFCGRKHIVEETFFKRNTLWQETFCGGNFFFRNNLVGKHFVQETILGGCTW